MRKPPEDVAVAEGVTHPFPVPEAHAGMMVTPSVKLLRPLGEGGMGTVWVAEHQALRTEVVVKFMATALKSSKEATERFSREAAAAAQVKSPHVVQTFDHGFTSDGTPYIVMELLEGRDLADHLDSEGRCSPELVVAIVSQLSRALDRAHERGIVHRDIKPGNIFLCDGGRGEVFVKLLDFGIAKGVELPSLDSGTKTGAMIGSPFYMSPEQILGSKGVDHRSDLWSVGVVAFEALTGQKPFDAETMGGLAIKIHSEPLPTITAFAPELSHAVDPWFQRACARPVTDRFASAKEMAEALAVALGGEVPRSNDLLRNTGPAPQRASTPALVAGSTTEAGIVRSHTSPTTRNRLVALSAFMVALGIGTFGIVRLLRTPAAAGGATVTSAMTTSPIEGAARATPATVPPPSAMVATLPSAHLSATASSEPAPNKAHPVRPKSVVRAPSSAAAAAPPPSTPPAPPPVPSGRDIY